MQKTFHPAVDRLCRETLYIVLLTAKTLASNLHWQEDEGRPPPQVGWPAFTIAGMPARIA
jgi:hypothetical protein